MSTYQLDKIEIMAKEVAIGIDLGTSRSCVGVWSNGKIEIIASDTGSRTTPSMVAFTDVERLIGDGALNQAAANPKNTIYDAKRLIGRDYSDPTVQSDMKLWPFKVEADGSNKPVIVVESMGETKKLHPEEVGNGSYEDEGNCGIISWSSRE